MRDARADLMGWVLRSTAYCNGSWFGRYIDGAEMTRRARQCRAPTTTTTCYLSW
jgi:hypothetical protein